MQLVLSITKPIIFYLNSFQAGVSYHNLLTMGDNNNRGHISSLLNLRYQAPERVATFAEFEFALPFSTRGAYLALTPLILYQKQSNLDYWEIGMKMAYKRNFAFGAYAHFNSRSDLGPNTSWYNLVIEFGGVVIEGRENNHRFDIGIAYADNFSGLQNVVGPIFELSISYHLNRSNVCNWIGRSDEVGYRNGALCPVSPSGKIYDRIW